jgi:hypothetical protein
MLMATGSSEALSRQSRPCPPDFEIVFIEQGRLECEPWFRARRTTVTRWLEESGKARLLKKRAAFVKHQRSIRKGNGKAQIEQPIVNDRRKVDRRLVALAIAFLQAVKNGGWVIYPRESGGYHVGLARKTAAEVIELAERKGFNRRRAIEQIKAFAEPN